MTPALQTRASSRSTRPATSAAAARIAAGVGYTLTTTNTAALANGVSSAFNITVGAATQVTLTVATNGVTRPPTVEEDRMGRATIRLDPAFTVGPVRPRIFGSFVEHMGRCVYTGIYEPGHPAADELGFRTDVADLVRELGVTVVRYPGGNFVSSYRWEDGVGPKADRPTQLDLAWRSVETNQVGTDDFVDWARGVGVEPMMAVNLGTRGVPEAIDLLLYCNGETGTSWPDRRAENVVLVLFALMGIDEAEAQDHVVAGRGERRRTVLQRDGWCGLEHDDDGHHARGAQVAPLIVPKKLSQIQSATGTMCTLLD